MSLFCCSSHCIQLCLISNLQPVTLHQSLSFMILTVLKSATNKKYFDFKFVQCFLGIRLSYVFLAKIPQEQCNLVSAVYQEFMSTCHITVNFNLDCLAKMVSAEFLYCKITIFLFIINKYLRGDTLRLCHPILKILLILASIGGSCLQQLF